MEVGQSGFKFILKHSKSKVYYSVFGCKSKACDNPELSFHRRMLWEKISKMGETVKPSMRVCLLHFKEEENNFF